MQQRFYKRKMARRTTLAIVTDITINLSALSSSDPEHLFRIISRCAPHRVLAPEVLYIIRHLLARAELLSAMTPCRPWRKLLLFEYVDVPEVLRFRPKWHFDEGVP